MPGKVDWLAHSLPIEGDQADAPTAGSVARNEVVTCRPKDRVGDVRPRIRSSPYGFGLVTTAEGVVLGRLCQSALDCDRALRTEAVMESGPSTVRPHTAATALAHRLARRNLRWAVVTDPEGRLIGITRREGLDAASGPPD